MVYRACASFEEKLAEYVDSLKQELMQSEKEENRLKGEWMLKYARYHNAKEDYDCHIFEAEKAMNDCARYASALPELDTDDIIFGSSQTKEILGQIIPWMNRGCKKLKMKWEMQAAKSEVLKIKLDKAQVIQRRVKFENRL